MSKKNKEIYFAGKKGQPEQSFSEQQSDTLKEFPDFEAAVSSKLRKYIELQEEGIAGGTYTGKGILDNKIRLKVREFYIHPGETLNYAEFELTYKPGVSEENVNIVRKALTSSGLEKKLDNHINL